jgi:hypothetical protein
MKANGNPAILKIMKENGCSLTLVSGLELKLALELEFPPDEIVFNGNGKQGMITRFDLILVQVNYQITLTWSISRHISKYIFAVYN